MEENIYSASSTENSTKELMKKSWIAPAFNDQLGRFKIFEEQIEKATKECSNVYILGDINLDLCKLNDKNYYLKKVSEEYESLYSCYKRIRDYRFWHHLAESF